MRCDFIPMPLLLDCAVIERAVILPDTVIRSQGFGTCGFRNLFDVRETQGSHRISSAKASISLLMTSWNWYMLVCSFYVRPRLSRDEQWGRLSHQEQRHFKYECDKGLDKP
ncbi:hypothetical protein MPTK1_5g17280 [Marchantia polymorpha subsp. ruderalis]|uniref:Uncharacterized protein n=2 Tax=Marchantia polymorpha TaxID=3197 RepID=A0AAF6BJA4_MARPO|nr:hypothetical protein MARPO_0182s0021 [Marchantia polymorpha]BBN12088.1 hypothetical protein Mp_5g17280 [Marchantia polymorpha subsp. ruderalis]|eukprot:PTQ27845.1 hypothetical protein MARPO_0182s0021 [Marchantia polymorpha]